MGFMMKFIWDFMVAYGEFLVNLCGFILVLISGRANKPKKLITNNSSIEICCMIQKCFDFVWFCFFCWMICWKSNLVLFFWRCLSDSPWGFFEIFCCNSWIWVVRWIVGRYLVLLGGKKGKWWIPSGVRKNVACWKIACLSMILPAINLYHPLI